MSHHQSDIRIIAGLDLGRTRNFTALAVLEERWHPATVNEFIASGSRGYQGEFRYRVIGLDRCSLGTPFPEAVEWVKRMLKAYGEIGALVADATGLGSVVMDLLRRADLGTRVIGTVITGDQASPPGAGMVTAAGYETVSRAELLTGLQVAIQLKKFTISQTQCREWEALSRELVLLRLEGKKTGVQDDLAQALALAVWWGIRPGRSGR